MRPQPGIWVISSSRARAPVRVVTMRKAAEGMAARLAAEQARAREAHEHLAEATAAHAAEGERRAGQRAELVAGQAREAVTAARAEATVANARAESASAEVERGRQDAERALGELRASMQREREETAARWAAALESAQAAAEPERVRADSTWQREELRQVLDGRASVLEEARAELRARAGRAGRELDHVRAELAELGRA
jgi:flagellar biosynthesis GTPase FlhF